MSEAPGGQKIPDYQNMFTEVAISSAAIISYLPKHKAKDQE